MGLYCPGTHQMQAFGTCCAIHPFLTSLWYQRATVYFSCKKLKRPVHAQVLWANRVVFPIPLWVAALVGMIIILKLSWDNWGHKKLPRKTTCSQYNIKHDYLREIPFYGSQVSETLIIIACLTILIHRLITLIQGPKVCHPPCGKIPNFFNNKNRVKLMLYARFQNPAKLSLEFSNGFIVFVAPTLPWFKCMTNEDFSWEKKGVSKFGLSV